jgi:hypothetical protein
MLTINRLREVLAYNADDGEWTWLKRTGPGCNKVPGERAGSIDKDMGYRILSIDGEKYRGARLAYFYVNGRWPKGQMDHKDRVRSNDAWANLRVVTGSRNSINRPGVGKSKLKGVDLHRGRWRARLRVDGKLIDLGYYESAISAALAYDIQAFGHYGTYAKLNFETKSPKN